MECKLITKDVNNWVLLNQIRGKLIQLTCWVLFERVHYGNQLNEQNLSWSLKVQN